MEIGKCKKMKSVSIREMKNIELELIQKFDKICNENRLKYSIAYGTLLGAIRHKGFIPWDDDIDVIMPREDYIKLLELDVDSEDVCLKSFRKSKNYYYSFAKLISRKTIVLEPHRYEKDMGVWIDIFPVDFFEYENIDRIVKIARKYKKISDFVNSKACNSNILTYPIKFLIKRVAHLFSKKILKRHEKLVSSTDGEYFIQATYNLCGKKDSFKSELWDNIKYYAFENTKIKGFANYDYYLKSLYGDYMKLPPKEEQKSHHRFEAYYKEKVK